MKTETFRYYGRAHRCTIGERELHCGDCFELEVRGKWIDVRIEFSDDWYFIGLLAGTIADCDYHDCAHARRYAA